MGMSRKHFLYGLFFFLLLLFFSLPAWADHPQDGNHDLAEMPVDCVGCHNSEGGTNFSVVGEHRFRLGYDNHRLCAYCHYNPDSPFFNDPTFPWDPDPDLAVAITFGRRNTNPRGYIEPVYCAYCHVTENRSTHVHVGEHDQVVVPPSCGDCHGSDLVDIHIDPDKNLPADADLPDPSSPGYAVAYAAGLANLKLSCYTCHGDAVIGTAPWDSGHIYFQPDPAVRSAVASGIAGSDVTCADCHGVVDHAGAHDHAVITPGSCIDCHSDNVVVEHIDNHGLDCNVCHQSTDPAVVQAIADGSGPAGVDVDCNACHGVVDHDAAHDHAIVPSDDCLRCHAASIVREHAAHGLDCAACHDSIDPVVSGAIADGISGTDVSCYVCHPGAAAWHETAHDSIYLRTKVAGVESIITSGDDATDGLYDNLPAYRPSLTCGVCHAGIAENHWGNFHSGLRMADIFDASGTPLARGVLDPSRPWITGPGMLGNWCPTYNRQLPDLNATFASESEFSAKVDMGVFEFIRECGSCHVGGGPGVENPFGFSGFASPALDDPIRAAALDAGTVALNPWDFFVDNGLVTRGNWAASGILDVDCLMCHLEGYNHLQRNARLREAAAFAQAAPVGAGLAMADAAMPEVLDYNTVQVDRDGSNQLYLSPNLTYRITGLPRSENCLACHMPDMVMHENEAVTGDLWQNRFFSAAAVPSDDPTNPDPLLAANKEPALYRNGMLKRGATWRRDEVHKFMECSGCHSRTAKTQSYDPVSAADSYLHSPGKGIDPLKYPSAADGTVKLCEDCHVRYGDLNDDGQQDFLDFAPPEMQVRHYQSGLLANIVPTARRIVDASGTEETFTGNHLDIISCTACHVQKRYSAARLVDYGTGGRYYNLVGTPPDQLPSGETVNLAYTWKENVADKVIDGQPNPEWRRQIFPFNYLTSSYWDNTGTADANGDGFLTGDSNGGQTVIGDPFFQREIKSRFAFDYVNAANDRVASGLLGVTTLDERTEWAMAGTDGNVLFTQPAEIDAFQAVMSTVNSGYDSRLTLESRPFLLAHNVMPIRSGVGLSGGASYALGAPDRDALGQVVAYGCNDCHGGGGGVFNGTLSMLGNGKRISDGVEEPLTISWNDAGDVQATALAWDHQGNPFTVDFSSGNQTRDPERREFLAYDAGRVTALNAVTPAAFGLGVDPVAAIATINGIAATVPQIDLEVGTTAELVASAAGSAGSFQYRWNINDEPGTLTGQTVSKTFSHNGLWNVMLTVIDEEGRLTQDVQQVNVTNPNPATSVQVSTTAGSPGVTLSLSNLPTHTQIKFYFGDGTRQYISDSGAAYVMSRNYRLRDTYLKDTDANGTLDSYVYKTSIQVINASDIVEVINVGVVIPQ